MRHIGFICVYLSISIFRFIKKHRRYIQKKHKYKLIKEKKKKEAQICIIRTVPEVFR